MVDIVVADNEDSTKKQVYPNGDEMAQNIANAIVTQCQHGQIVPEDSETFTEIVYVKEWYSDKQIIEHP